MIQVIEKLGPAPKPTEVARLLGLDRTSVYRMLYAGRLKKLTGFGRVRICPKSLEAILSASSSHTPRPTKRWRKAVQS
jgi:DNA-binding IclR family transcriptional regulator